MLLICLILAIILSCLNLGESFRLTSPSQLKIPLNRFSSLKPKFLPILNRLSSKKAENDSTDNSIQIKKKGILQNLKKYIIPLLLVTSIPIFSFQHAAHASGISGFQESLASLSKTANDSGFVQSFLLIFISEIGDKTFFIAALLAAKYGKILSFLGSMSALAVMTVISTVLGQIFHAVPSSISQGIPFDDFVAIAAFSYFGIKTLYDASKIQNDDNSGLEGELEEAEEEVSKLNKRDSVITLFLQIFSLVFAAEIGDRSFLSTIALSAALNPYAVGIGAVAAHGTATGVAVIGGDLLSKYLSEKVIGYIGGTLFLVFAITTAFGVF